MVKGKQRLLAFALALTMVCSNEIVALAETKAIVVDEGMCGDNLTWELDRNGTLTISGSGDMYDYGVQSDEEYLSTPWTEYSSNIYKLEIGDGVTSIGKEAFAMCTDLTGELDFPDSMCSIGDYAFTMCMGLTGDLILPDSVAYIGEGAFSYCVGLTGDLVIPAGLTNISDYAFTLCTGLKGELTIPEGVESIGAYAFSSCASLTGDLMIPESVMSIGESAFAGCSGFTGELTLPSTITSIEACTFDGCSGFTGELILPEGLTSIGLQAFNGCSGFACDLVIPENVSEIGAYAFYGCSSLTGVEFPANLKSFGNYAFSLCTDLYSIVIPEKIKTIPEGAFYGCRNLTNAQIPNGVTSIAAYAFAGCAIQEIVFPETLKTLNEYAFYDPEDSSMNHTKLEKVVFWGASTKIPVGFTKSLDEDAEIHGLFGSTAETFASKYRYTFISIDDDRPIVDGNPFVDVQEGKWFYTSVLWAYSNGLITGTSSTKFSPNSRMTRGMFVTVLYRMEGRPEVSSDNKFKDVSSKKYYATAVTWASDLGLVAGFSKDIFGPENNIAREQIAKILYLFAQYKGCDVTNTTDISGFADASNVSSYAKKYMEWAVAEGLIKGSNGKLNPKGNATRAEIAAILKRFVEKYELL